MVRRLSFNHMVENVKTALAFNLCHYSKQINYAQISLITMISQIYMWQSWVEIEHYSAAYFECITVFEVL